jgi:hypothetical protein
MSSEPQLYEVGVISWASELACRVLERWELPDDHGDLVAGGAAGTVDAIFRDFVRQSLMICSPKVETLEKGGDAGEEADAGDAAGLCLIEESANEETAGSAPLRGGCDGDGADLGEVLTVDVEGSASDELVGGGFNDGEGADVGADLCVTPGKQGAVVGEAMDQVVDGAGVLQLRLARSHGCCGDLVFRGEGDCE